VPALDGPCFMLWFEPGKFGSASWGRSRPIEWCSSVCLGMMAQGAERPEASSPGGPAFGVVIVDLR